MNTETIKLLRKGVDSLMTEALKSSGNATIFQVASIMTTHIVENIANYKENDPTLGKRIFSDIETNIDDDISQSMLTRKGLVKETDTVYSMPIRLSNIYENDDDVCFSGKDKKPAKEIIKDFAAFRNKTRKGFDNLCKRSVFYKETYGTTEDVADKQILRAHTLSSGVIDRFKSERKSKGAITRPSDSKEERILKAINNVVTTGNQVSQSKPASQNSMNITNRQLMGNANYRCSP